MVDVTDANPEKSVKPDILYNTMDKSQDSHEEVVTRETLEVERANLRAFTSRQIRSTLCKIGIFLLVIILALFLASDSSHKSILHDGNVPHGAMENLKDNMAKLRKKFEKLWHDDSHKHDAELEGTIKKHTKDLEEFTNQLQTCINQNEKLKEDMLKLKESLENVMNEQKNNRNKLSDDNNSEEQLNAELTNLIRVMQDLKELKEAIKSFALRSDLDMLKMKLEIELNGIKGDLLALKEKVEGLSSLPSLQLEVQKMVREEFERHPPPPPPPPHHHPPHHGHHHDHHHHRGRGKRCRH